MDLLKRAREFVANNTVADCYKCRVHLTPETGWLNDPNGYSFYNGKYHMFYQFYPYATHWGMMHWGHATSSDCIKWEYAPVALAPKYPFAIGKACYSGSAIEHNGAHYLMFTQNGIGQRQCLAYSTDGVDYTRIMKPVIAEKDLPADVSIGNFRDPKVYKRGSKFYVLIGGRQKGNVKFGNILLFSSDDLYSWKYIGKLFEKSFCIKHFEDMAECPDFFTIGGKDVIVVSPWRKQKVLYSVGSLDYETGKFASGDVELLDYGTDFFATQSTTIASGDVVLSAWAQGTVSAENPMVKHGWNGLLTLPRKVTLKDNKIYQMPIEALKNYRKNCEKFQGELVASREMSTHGDVLDIELKFNRIKDGDGIVLYADNEGNGLKVYYEKGFVKIDRTLNYRTSVASAAEYILSAPVDTNNGALNIRIVLDKFIIEVFANEGQRAFSTLVAHTPERTKVVLVTASKTECEAELYNIN
ncbi:MAG: GH32 C-terminal domain-containing protein [Bacillota bacterium]